MYTYNKKFYEYVEMHTSTSAKIVMPYIINLLNPKSVVDFGCAEGIWLEAARETDPDISVLGLDGDYVDRSRLKIPPECFRAVDLSKPIRLPKKYDLAISLEVAEHISEKNSTVFIENITNASDNILFSAAVPGQGGENHLNEQWQSYWVKKFEGKGYYADESIRDAFWNEKRIIFWYKQNILFFSKKEKSEDSKKCKHNIYDIVHPELAVSLRMAINELESQIYFLLTHEEEYKKIDLACKRAVEMKKDIIIYPFGMMGRICKKILNNKYRVLETAIVDNKLRLDSLNSISVRDLSELKENFIVLECCSNPGCKESVMRELREVVEEKNISSIFG